MTSLYGHNKHSHSYHVIIQTTHVCCCTVGENPCTHGRRINTPYRKTITNHLGLKLLAVSNNNDLHIFMNSV